ncbi:MAG: hypothetical protein D4R64_01040 [Porphyromonadaceae bacterium]|nr:MAG: hypothetical protein D4R64_01040 [Porphyromonadaceae bacterium]
MKRAILFAGILTISLFVSVINAQNDCKVLMPGISDSYTGSCKQGLADGPGEAFGIDQYKGKFKKGFPDGVGTYIWQTGETYKGEWKKGLREGDGKYTFKFMGRDSVLAGVWKEDKYIGERALAPYVIDYRNNIGRVSCMKVGDRPYVKYKFFRNGGESNNISNLLMQGSSGSENTTSFTGFEQVTFPFKGKVIFNAPNSFQTATITCELRFIINEPGSWIVTMFY